MPRIKDVTLDGVTLTISAFPLEKAEELFPVNQPERSPEERRAYIHKIIAESLNGAGGDTALWTLEKIRKEFDLVLIGWLYDQILDFNGLKAAPAGEEKAAAA